LWFVLRLVANALLKVVVGIAMGELQAMLFAIVLNWRFPLLVVAGLSARWLLTHRDALRCLHGGSDRLRTLALAAPVCTVGLFALVAILWVSTARAPRNRFGFVVDYPDRDYVQVHESNPSVPRMHVQTNSLGYRDDEWNLEAPQRRVLLVGDSFVWGVGIREKAGMLDAAIEAELNVDQPARPWNALNLALKPSGLRYYMAALRATAEQTRAEAMVMCYLGLTDDYLVDEQILLSRPGWAPALRRFGVSDDLMRHNAVGPTRAIQRWLVQDWERRRLREELQTFIAYLERRGIPLIVWEHRVEDPLFDPFRRHPLITFVNWRDTGRRNELDAPDWLDGWLAEPGFAVPDDGHPTELANREFARVIARSIRAATDGAHTVTGPR
jgi:hypothetical protein